nr:aldehyde dehydrogenase family protein [Sphingomonas alba]
MVDCQEDYLARESLQPPRGTLIAAIAETLEAARTQGWPVVHVRTRVAADGSGAMPHRRGAPEAVDGTPGAAAPPELQERPGEPVLFKRFFSAFDAPGLDTELQSLGVERLLVAGVHSHACIQATVLDAYAHGFEVVIGEDLVGSYDAAHGAQALRWLDGRAASVKSSAAIFGKASKTWSHFNPCDARELLFEAELTRSATVTSEADRLRGQPDMPIAERSSALSELHRRLSSTRGMWVEALIRDLGKPRVDAEGEFTYGLGLLEHVVTTLQNEEAHGSRRVRYRPVGVAGLITPWNNPFAIPLAKLAPALAYGNKVLWKPAPQGSRIASMLRDSLADVGLGESIAMLTGDGVTGQAVLASADLFSFTGSVPVGRLIVAEAGRRAIPAQAELGGSNAAIVDGSADLEAAASDLAAAIFSFAGQRCTAIRRVIVLDAVYDVFVERLAAAVDALSVGDPAGVATQVGPVIDKASQRTFLSMGAQAAVDLSERGCWVRPTLVIEPRPDHPLLRHEVFGPLAAVLRVRNLDAAIASHNSTDMGLLGALFSNDAGAHARFLAEAQAGILSIGKARPPFAADGPFTGWKASGYGVPEHGRWNRDFYTRAQAIYGH